MGMEVLSIMLRRTAQVASFQNATLEIVMGISRVSLTSFLRKTRSFSVKQKRTNLSILSGFYSGSKILHA